MGGSGKRMTLKEKNKKLLELVEKYDKFAMSLRSQYFSELNSTSRLCSMAIMSIINETDVELYALRNELGMIKNDK